MVNLEVPHFSTAAPLSATRRTFQPPFTPLPIKVRQRDALFAGGKVSIFTNTSTRTLSVVARFKNPTFGTRKVFNLVFSPGDKQEIGGFEGWTVVPGESVTLESEGYTEASYTFID
jgi:hypothetical protein